MFKRYVSFIMCILMLTSSFVGMGEFVSAKEHIVDEIMDQAHNDSVEEPSVMSTDETAGLNDDAYIRSEDQNALGSKDSADVMPDAVAATYSGKCGDNLTWILDIETGVLVISGTGDMYGYWNVSPWKNYINYIKSVNIGMGVTSIGGYSFYECEYITSVDIAESVTRIGSAAFRGCKSLIDITIPNGVDSIDMDTFSGCSSLVEVNLSESVKGIYNLAFAGCDSLKSIVLLNSVVSIDREAFLATPVTIRCYENSYAHDYAVDNGIPFELLMGECGNDQTWSFDVETSTLNIYGIGYMYDYSADTAPWTEYAPDIKRVIIDNSVESIGAYAFYNCTALTDIDIPDSVAAIGDSAFYCCSALEEITLPDTISIIGGSVFVGSAYYNNSDNWRDGILYVGNHLVNADSSISGEYVIREGTITVAGAAFFGCTDLTGVVLPDSAVSIGWYAFSHCFSLERIYIPASVTSIGGSAFSMCHSVNIVCLRYSEAFYYAQYEEIPFEVAEIYCSSCGDDLKWSLNTATGVFTVTGSGEMYDYKSLYSDGYRNDAPWKYYSLHIKAVVIEEGVTSIGLDAFLGCSNITYISIPSTLTSIESRSFYNCTALMAVYINDIESWCKISFKNDYSNPLYYAKELYLNGELLTHLEIPDTVIEINDMSFINCTSLESVIISNNVVSIGWGAFEGCSSLVNVVIPDSVTYIDWCAFRNCVSLADISVPDSVTFMGGVVIDNTAYFNNLDNWIDKLLYIDNHLVAVDKSIDGECNIRAGTVTICRDAFIDCRDITKVTIPDSVVSVPEGAFCGCISLVSVVIGDSVKSIGVEGFFYCTSLKDIKFGDTLEYIAPSAFFGCEALESIDLPDSVKVIGASAFVSCISLKSIIIPDSVTTIGSNAFNGCTSLSSIFIPNSVTTIGEYAVSSNSTIICYENSYAHEYAVNNGNKYRLLVTDDHTHTYTLETLRESTCTATGIGMYLCACGDYYIVVLPTIDHVFTNYVYNWDETCTSDGTSTAYCDFGCGTSDTVIAGGTMNPHMFVFYEYNNDGNCEYPGTMTAYCAFGCGTSDTIPADNDRYGHTFTSEIIEEPTCVSEGMRLCMCKCGKYYTELIATIPHIYTDYTYNNDATCSEFGTKTAYCDYGCGNSNTITAEGIYADHDLFAAVYEPSNCITSGFYGYMCRNCSVYIVESIPRPDHVYTKWEVIKEPTETEPGIERSVCDTCMLVDKEREIPCLGTPEPYLTSEGVQLTVHELHNVKDYFIAEGDHETYREVKNNMVVSIGAAKIGTNTSYTYMVKSHGIHTVYIRYTDGSYRVLKTEITGVEPEFTVNGLQLTVKNLENVKVIRTAYGDYDKVSTMKKVTSHRGFTAKSSIKGADEYLIQYRDKGTVTVAVVYNDGYEAFYTYEVQQKIPTIEQKENTVVFGNLDGLYNIRYAKGEYKTSAQIKAAAGSVAVKPSRIDENGNITVKLSVGTYTFCVQYDDESFNYYTITVE